MIQSPVPPPKSKYRQCEQQSPEKQQTRPFTQCAIPHENQTQPQIPRNRLSAAPKTLEKIQRKNSLDFTSAYKKGPLHMWSLVNFPNPFQNTTFFYKSLEIFISLGKKWQLLTRYEK